MKIVFSTFLLLMFFLSGCKNAADPAEYEKKTASLEARIRKTTCARADLQHQIDSLWNTAVAAIEKDLPTDTEPGTKANFLGLKSEQLLKMLPEYASMRANTRQLIAEAAHMDSVLTLKFNGLRKEFQAYETEMQQFLQEVETQNPELRQEYLQRLQTAQKEACKAG